MDLRKLKAFTLAEVLVTLGIIGVVSAMTVPTLMNNYQRQTYVVQLHKVYNEMSQALTQYSADKNAMSLKEAGLTSSAAVNDFVKSYFKVVKSCTTTADCFAPLNEYKTLAGNPVTLTNTESFVLASGASIRPLFLNDNNILLSIVVDTNGKKGPNIAGRDLIPIYLYKNGLIDDYIPTSNAPLSITERESLYTTYCKSATGADTYGCFGKILNDNWQMTY